MRKYLCKASAIALSALMVASYTPASAYASTDTNKAGVESQQQTREASADVDVTALTATIEKADGLDEMSYTKATWDVVEAANKEAKKALEAKESQSAVDAANQALESAISGLKAAGDQTDLKSALASAKALDKNDYTVKSWKYVQQYIDNAETVIANRADKTTLKRAKNNLNLWVGQLVKAYDTAGLKKVLAQAEALKKADYTTDSWKESNISLAILSAQDAIDNREDKDGVHGAIVALENAMDALVPITKQVTVGRGNFEQKLAPGTYKVPVDLLNGGKSETTNQYTSGNYMSQLSMAHGCFVNDTATIVIHEDGTATFTVGVQAISAQGQTGAASDWTIYEDTQDYLDGKATASNGIRFKARVDESKVQGGKKKPSKISFTIPDLKQNVVATRMYIEVMSVNQNACIGLDWANVEKVSDSTSETSTVEKEYVVAPDAQRQLKNLKAGQTVKLDQDVTLTDDLTIKGGTVDLNGHTLNQADNLITVKGNVTFIDSSADKSGKITCAKYFDNTRTTSSIYVQSGSLTADGVTIDGQIGNAVATSESNYMTTKAEVDVKLTNCTLVNTLGLSDKNNVCFMYMDKGVNLTIDNCTADKGVNVSSGAEDKTTITNSTIGTLSIEGASATVEKVTTANTATLSADNMTIKDNTFAGIKINGKADATIENVNSTVTNGAALTVSGSGQITVKGGVYISENGNAVSSQGFPIQIESGYFKGISKTVEGAYTTPSGKILGDVTEGEYAGYQTVIDGETPAVKDPVATIYNADGTVAKEIAADDAQLALSYAKAGQTVKLNENLQTTTLTYYKNCTLDLNGHTLSLGSGITGNNGICRVIDSSNDKTGKLVSSGVIFMTNTKKVEIILDNINCEALYVQTMSAGSVHVINGTTISGVSIINALQGGGMTNVQESSWVIADKDDTGNDVDGEALLAGSTRTSQYTITKIGDHSFKVTANELGKEMRAFEEIDSSAYTKSSYAAAKAVYDEIDNSADEDIQGDTIATKAKELKDAVAKLVKAASEDSLKSLTTAVEEAKSYKADDYTEASYKAFSEAVAAAEKLVNSGDASEEAVNAALKAIETAKAGLVKAEPKPATPSTSTTTSTTTTAKKDDTQAIKIVKGKVYVVAGKQYKVTSASVKSGTVAFAGLKNKKTKSVVIPATVKINGVTCTVIAVGDNALKNYKSLKKVTVGYNVTQIGKQAFAGSKNLKSIVVKSTKINKVGSKSLKGIHKKAVVKVPSKKLKAYKKLFKNKGQKKTVKIKK